MTSFLSGGFLVRLAVPACIGMAALSACGGGGGSGSSMTVQNPTAAYVYVAARGSAAGGAGAVYEYAVKSDHTLSALTQASIDAGVDPAAVAVNGAEHSAYVVNVGDGTISQYAIASDATLTAMSPATVANPGMKTLGVAPAAAIVDPTGSFLYVANSQDNTLSQFSIGTGGRLTPLTPATVAAGIQPVSIVASTVTSGPIHIYVLNAGAAGTAGSISQYTMGLDGTLTPLNPASVPAGTNPVSMTIDQELGTAYVVNDCQGSICAASITQFAFGADGQLAATSETAVTGSHYGAVSVITDSSGAHAYLLTNLLGVDTLSGALWQFSLGTDGTPNAATPAELSVGSPALAQTIQNATVYVLTSNSGVASIANATGGSINTYTLASDGGLASAGTAPIAVDHPVAMGLLILLPP